MWIITHVHTGNKHYLISEVEKYIIGRVGSDIVLVDDTSISRSHAILHITDASLKLEDTGSKYGTYYNEHIETKTKLPKGSPIELKEGDRVLFGALKNEWLISKNHITTMVSSLSGPLLSEVKSRLNKLGGKIITKWEPSCTHLTMSEITITIKVLHALIEKIPIVSCEYWKDYLQNMRETKQPPKASPYLPERSAVLSSAIDLANFKFNDKRKTLFTGKTFVFMSKKHSDMYTPIVRKAGGECKDLRSSVSKSYLLQKDIIVIQYIPSTQSQGSQTINSISEYLEASSLRTIPEYEIGLAIVCCTTEKYCNPSYNTISAVLANSADRSPNIGTILAENTGQLKSQLNMVELSIAEVPDSDCSTSNAVAGKPLHSEIYEDNQSESNVVTIENSEASEGMDCISQIPDSSLTCENKRKRDESDENLVDMRSLKKINTSNREMFSEHLIVSSDIISNEIEALNPTKCTKVNEKRKRPLKVVDDELQIAKKIHISPALDANFCKASNQKSVTTEKAARNKPEKTIQTKPTENQKNSSNQVSKKTSAPTSTRYSGFLHKSQINHSQRELQSTTIGKQPENKAARGCIARITDNDSEGEDDLFNFGSSPKKSRTLDCKADDELFAFGSKPSEDTVDRTIPNNEEVLAQTQRFIPNNSFINSKVKKLNIKVSPLKFTSDGWLTKLNLLNIKSDNAAEVKKENNAEDSKQNEWIDSIKGGFEVRVRKMNLTSKGSYCSTVQDSSNSALNTTKKNFKAFVKKHNYKPQTLIVPTVPMVVSAMKY